MYAAYRQGMLSMSGHIAHETQELQSKHSVPHVAKLLTFHVELKMGLGMASDHLQTNWPHTRAETCMLCHA